MIPIRTDVSSDRTVITGDQFAFIHDRANLNGVKGTIVLGERVEQLAIEEKDGSHLSNSKQRGSHTKVNLQLLPLQINMGAVSDRGKGREDECRKQLMRSRQGPLADQRAAKASQSMN